MEAMATSSSAVEEDKVSILPGLPDGVALRCLAFIPRLQHARLRCVNTRWRDLFKQDLSMHTLRRSMGLTQNYLLLIPREYNGYGSPQTLACYEIQLHPPTQILSYRKWPLRTPLHADELPSLRGHACISMGPFVLILGGAHLGPKPLGQLHIFDTASSAWWSGANMQFPRSDFAWGVIGSHLYVAGGFVDEDVGHIQQAEVYDFDANRWSRLPDMPLCILIDLFFVHNGALYVRGCLCDSADNVLQLFSYHPSENKWKDEEWMLGNVLNNVKPLTTNKITALQDKDDDTLYMLDIQGQARSGYGALLARLKVMKLAPGASEWESHFEISDVVRMSSECPCSEAIYRDPSFPSIGKRVVVMDHLDIAYLRDYDDDDDDEEMDVEFIRSTGVLRLSLACPARWDVVVINA